MLQLLPEKALHQQVPSESKNGVKKLVSISVTSMRVIEIKEEAVKAVKVGKDGAEGKSEYPNLAQVLCIRYPITFQKKSLSMLALFNLGSEITIVYPTLAWVP